jgi:diphosphomevalonate decarboxylase
LLYPKQYADKILSFVKDQLLTYCQAGEYLLDSVGQGAKKL